MSSIRTWWPSRAEGKQAQIFFLHVSIVAMLPPPCLSELLLLLLLKHGMSHSTCM